MPHREARYASAEMFAVWSSAFVLSPSPAARGVAHDEVVGVAAAARAETMRTTKALPVVTIGSATSATEDPFFHHSLLRGSSRSALVYAESLSRLLACAVKMANTLRSSSTGPSGATESRRRRSSRSSAMLSSSAPKRCFFPLSIGVNNEIID